MMAVLPIFLFPTFPTCGILVAGEDGFSSCFDGEKASEALTDKGFLWYTSVNWVRYTHSVGKASEREERIMTASLNQIADQETARNIEEITNRFVDQLNPVKVFLFGSFADGSYNDSSDYDFYIVVKDNDDPWDSRRRARRAIRDIQKRPVDIVIGTNSRFQKYGTSADTLFIECEVFKKGVLLYDQVSAR